MQKPGLAPQMRGYQSAPKARPWFRIDNAFVQEGDGETTPVYIYDEIGYSWLGGTPADEFIQQISAIKTPNIELHLNSPGGDIFDGYAIYNALKAHPARVKVVVDALAASAASFIAQAGDEIVMTKASVMMIHDGSAMAWGPASVMRDTADLLDKLSNIAAGIYADRAGQSSEFWRNLMIEEVWYDAAEAVAAGLADKVGEDTKEEDDLAAQNKWDLSIFNYAGRGAAPDPSVVRQRIANQLKENAVAGPQNNEGDKPQETGSPETDPNAQTTEGTAGDTDKEREEESSSGAVPEPPTGDQSTVKNSVKVKASDPRVIVNGQTYQVPAAVQAHMTMLETFRTDTLTEGRKTFVENLAKDNKIMAAQVPKLTAYALGLDDAGFEAWKSTYDDVPGLPMLQGSPASETTNNATGLQSQVAEKAATDLDTAKDIVRQHKLSGMPKDKIKNTKSYKTIMQLEPDFKL